MSIDSMPGSSGRVSSVVSRFEATIKRNNTVGVKSEMYLNNIAKRRQRRARPQCTKNSPSLAHDQQEDDRECDVSTKSSVCGTASTVTDSSISSLSVSERLLIPKKKGPGHHQQLPTEDDRKSDESTKSSVCGTASTVTDSSISTLSVSGRPLSPEKKGQKLSNTMGTAEESHHQQPLTENDGKSDVSTKPSVCGTASTFTDSSISSLSVSGRPLSPKKEAEKLTNAMGTAEESQDSCGCSSSDSSTSALPPSASKSSAAAGKSVSPLPKKQASPPRSILRKTPKFSPVKGVRRPRYDYQGLVASCQMNPLAESPESTSRCRISSGGSSTREKTEDACDAPPRVIRRLESNDASDIGGYTKNPSQDSAVTCAGNNATLNTVSDLTLPTVFESSSSSSSANHGDGGVCLTGSAHDRFGACVESDNVSQTSGRSVDRPPKLMERQVSKSKLTATAEPSKNKISKNQSISEITLPTVFETTPSEHQKRSGDASLENFLNSSTPEQVVVGSVDTTSITEKSLQSVDRPPRLMQRQASKPRIADQSEKSVPILNLESDPASTAEPSTNKLSKQQSVSDISLPTVFETTSSEYQDHSRNVTLETFLKKSSESKQVIIGSGDDTSTGLQSVDRPPRLMQRQASKPRLSDQADKAGPILNPESKSTATAGPSTNKLRKNQSVSDISLPTVFEEARSEYRDHSGDVAADTFLRISSAPEPVVVVGGVDTASITEKSVQSVDKPPRIMQRQASKSTLSDKSVPIDYVDGFLERSSQKANLATKQLEQGDDVSASISKSVVSVFLPPRLKKRHAFKPSMSLVDEKEKENEYDHSCVDCDPDEESRLSHASSIKSMKSIDRAPRLMRRQLSKPSVLQ